MTSILKRFLSLALAAVFALTLVSAAFAEAVLSDVDHAHHGLGRLETPLRGSADKTVSDGGDTREDLPAQYDSRDYGYITPVKDQGSYNTCWAFGTAASCEAYMIKHGVHVGENGPAADQSLNLSEYHLAYYTYADAYDAEGMLTGDKTYFLSSHANGSFLEAGGTGELVSYPLMRWTGLADESEVALMYSSANPSGLGSEHAYQNNVAHVTSVKHFFGANVDEVKRHIMEYGAGSMGVRVSNTAGTAYHGGVNTGNGTICWIQSAVPYVDTGFYYADHDVTVVGWDDNFAKENFNQGYRPNNNGAWIVKNSWGTGIGDNGYFYVSYEDSATCASYISFFTVEDVDNYDHNYQYDGSGNYYNSEEMVTGDSIAQVFTANGNETLEAIALALYGDDTDYTVKIYTDCEANDPSSGTLASVKTGNFDYWGYRTIELDAPVTLTPGMRFAVVITFSGSDINVAYDTTIQEDQYYHMGLIHMTHPNTSYFRGVNETGWTNKSGDGNYRVKAFTKDVPEDPVPVDLYCVALGEVYETIHGTAGDKVQLPSTAPAADGWSFMGWVTAPLNETADKPSFYKPGATFKLTASISAVYALYMRAEAINAPVTYELITAMPDTWEGRYVLVAATQTGSTEYALTGMSAGTDGTNIEDVSPHAATLFSSTGITRTGTTLSTVPDAYVFEVSATNYGLSLMSVSEGSWFGSKNNGSGNAAYVFYAYPEFQQTNTTWTFEIDGDEMYLKNNSAGQVPYLAVSGSFGFSLTRYGSEFKFYKQNPTENYYYATEIAGGAHTHDLTFVAAVEPTCGANGHTAYWFCPGCGRYFSDAEGENEIAFADTVIPATGEHDFSAFVSNNNGTHSHICSVCGHTETENCTYIDTVTEPTEIEQGYTTHTCTVCGYSYTDSYTGPLGSDFPVHFSVPSGVVKPADQISNGDTGITLPTVSAPEGYTFLGWVEEVYDNATVRPAEILTGNYVAQHEVTLYALFSYFDGEGGGSAFELVTSEPADWEGRYVITNNNTSIEYVLRGVTPSSNGALIENDSNTIQLANSGITNEGGVLTNVADDYVFTLASNNGGFTLQSVSTGAYYGMNSSSFLCAYTELNTDYCRWIPAIDSSGRAQLKNAANGSFPYLSFSVGTEYFWSGSSSTADVLKLWKETVTGTTYYTTVIGSGETNLLGDVDCSGAVEFADISLLAKYLLNNEDGIVTEQGLVNADANLDEIVDVLDLAAICAIMLNR